ncbi:ATP-binding protein [Ruegeria sp. ANG-S4]|uniref:ATP-binding protein n=1 Tax=Ruegeria sp. ANG-S4 TaxID=1577904 RepID=UPI000691B5DE|nr:ATP-binding protein [Ruegeria sp. ANG-S4]
MLSQRKRRHKRTITLIYAAIVLLGVLSVAFMDRFIVAQKFEAERASVQRSLNSIRFRLERLIDSYSHMSRSLAIAQSFEADTEFQKLAGLLRNNNPSVINIARSKDFIITDVHPIEPNRQILGHDYRDHPDQLKSVQAALDTRETVIVGPTPLFQGVFGLLLRNAQPGQDNVVGNIVLDFERVLREAGMGAEPTVFMSSARIIGDDGADGPLVFGKPSVWDADPVRAEVTLGGTVVELAKTPTDGWHIDTSHRFILVLTTAVLVLIAFLGVNYARRLIIERAEARRQLLNAIESIHDGFVLFDRNDRMILCNERYRGFFETSKDVIVPGARFEDILRHGVRHGQYPEAIGREEDWIAKRMELHANSHGQTETELSDGRWIKVSEARTSQGGTVGIRTDITELKKALQTAEQAVRSKSEFINNMNHELRAPLSVVLGYIAFLRKVEIYPQYKALRNALESNPQHLKLLQEFTDVIVEQATKSESSGKHLLGLINSVLDWAKLSTGNVTLNPQKIDMDKLLNTLGEELGPVAADKGLNLEVTVEPAPVEGDPLRMRQIFMNLINNAIKFTEFGAIKISLEEQDGTVTVAVEDTGQGIPDDQLELIFNRFIQVDNAQKDGQAGTGLGLAITKNLVELHGGHISVSSTFGQGSRFQVVFPDQFPSQK